MPFLNYCTAHPFVFTIFFAYLLDLIIGDPKWLPHPVRWIGRYITFLENNIRKVTKNRESEKWEVWAGVSLFVLVVGSVYGFTGFLLYFTTHHSPLTTHLVSIFLAYTTLSIKSLHRESLSVRSALNDQSIDEARERLSSIVGRDTQNLSEDDIYRAVIETTSENTSDGIIAPIFYLAIGGPALAMAYKAVNTLDSMVGYKNVRYKNFGWFSARMDDIANFIPARLTAFLMVIASFILRLDWKKSLRIIWRDSRKHPSLNAGYPEAAVAGALNLQLGGTNYYFGEPHNRSLIGDREKEFTSESVRDTVKIMHVTAFLGVFAALSILWFFGWG